MEEVLGININDVFSLLIKVLLVLMCILSLVVVRQSSLMAKVVNVTINGWFRSLAVVYMVLCFVLTAIVLIV